MERCIVIFLVTIRPTVIASRTVKAKGIDGQYSTGQEQRLLMLLGQKDYLKSRVKYAENQKDAFTRITMTMQNRLMSDGFVLCIILNGMPKTEKH